jgi:lipoic acid synthetase/lipoate-protein ligase A
VKIERPIEGLALTEYLALEQEMVKTVSEPAIFTWIVAPTVIYGRHQSLEAEVNEPYCRAHGIAVVQRKSGGGCVYADKGNLMVSFISPSAHSEQVFAQFLELLSGALRRMDYEAVTTEHNDILVGGRKVCGTACYTTSTGTVVHASMLYDVNLEDLEAAITPSAAKLEKHAVASVRQRVRNLRDIRDIGDIHAFRDAIEEQFVIRN